MSKKVWIPIVVVVVIALIVNANIKIRESAENIEHPPYEEPIRVIGTVTVESGD